MDNLNIGHIAIAVVIVEFFNLLIIVLTKTETLLKVAERIKGIIGVDYRNRAKRSDTELRISKKHSLVAKERVRHSFVTMKLWRCRWTWNWSENFEPINIKGYCLGDKEFDFDNPIFRCNHPVEAWYVEGKKDWEGNEIISGFGRLGIYCTQEGESPHQMLRVEFDVPIKHVRENQPKSIFNPIILKAIMSERDLRIAREIKILRLQFWR